MSKQERADRNAKMLEESRARYDPPDSPELKQMKRTNAMLTFFEIVVCLVLLGVCVALLAA